VSHTGIIAKRHLPLLTIEYHPQQSMITITPSALLHHDVQQENPQTFDFE
jgi:hypothetical protein